MLAKFYSFKNGVHMSDSTINTWLNECRLELLDDKLHSSISSGDTLVACHRFNDFCQFDVSTDNGYSSFSCNFNELQDLEFDFKR